MESQREGLGQEFRVVVERHFHRISEHPKSFPTIRGEVRRAVVFRRFPFVIHFVIETKGIVILSVFHTSRDPDRLRYRR
jgi:plasmid stabilization system protein ParE